MAIICNNSSWTWTGFNQTLSIYNVGCFLLVCSIIVNFYYCCVFMHLRCLLKCGWRVFSVFQINSLQVFILIFVWLFSMLLRHLHLMENRFQNAILCMNLLHYILTIIDAYSKYTWVFPLKQKSDSKIQTVYVYRIMWPSSIPLSSTLTKYLLQNPINLLLLLLFGL